MQYENKILISAILIIGVALVSFNVIDTGSISGRASKGLSDVKISVSPANINCRTGQGSAVFTIMVDPQGNSVRRDGSIHDAGSYARIDTFKLGKASLHSEEVSVQHRMPCGVPGTYFARVLLRDGTPFASNKFTVG